MSFKDLAAKEISSKLERQAAAKPDEKPAESPKADPPAARPAVAPAAKS